MSIHIKEPGIPNTTKLTNSFARVYKFLFIIILLYRKTIYIGLFKQYFTFLKDFKDHLLNSMILFFVRLLYTLWQGRQRDLLSSFCIYMSYLNNGYNICTIVQHELSSLSPYLHIQFHQQLLHRP